MKLQVSFDIPDLEKALEVAKKIQSHVDIFEIGTLLIYKEGQNAIKTFRTIFPEMKILVDAKIIDRSKEAVTLFAESGADWITVMAGVSRQVIHTACTIAHSLGKKVMLDLADASSLGQTALEAQSLGVDALTFHKSSLEDEHLLFPERWEMVKGNTTLPIFIAAHINRDTVSSILSFDPDGIILGSAIVQAESPEQEIAYFADLIGKR